MFRKPSVHQKAVRRKRAMDEVAAHAEAAKEEVEIEEQLRITKELQKLRDKPRGLAVAAGRTTESDVEKVEAQTLASTFHSETHQADVDTRMEKYIEEQMQRKRDAEGRGGQDREGEGDADDAPAAGGEDPRADAREKRAKPEEEGAEDREGKLENEEDLYSIPKRLQPEPPKEEKSAAGWLAGIAEVELPIEFKMRNLEETEKAKMRMQKAKEDRLLRKEELAKAEGVFADTGRPDRPFLFGIRPPQYTFAPEADNREQSSDDTALRRFKDFNVPYLRR